MHPTLPAAIQAMLRPDFYPHPVTTPIQLLQTHISYVLLTGPYAYKVKKPVRFGFLDFSTLERRHHFCEAELRLNRRWAPELYVAVVPIVQSQTPGGFRLSGPGGVVDYAVQMHQFEQDGLMLFQEDRLTAEQLQALGQQVAQCHQAAPTSDVVRCHGDIQAIRQVDANNLALSQPYVGRLQTLAQYDATAAYIHGFQRDHSDWYQQRLAEDKIRECHGDLHLGNLCWFQDQLQMFDCIEFNTDFRYIDTINDVAFLVMDLEYHQRLDLANIFLNTYLEWTGDYRGALLLRPYLCMRAYIRANVNALAAADSSLTPQQQADKGKAAAAYYRFAWQYTQPQAGQLVLMSGLSGSGKTTVARRLATQIRAIHLRSDAVRKHLAGLNLRERGDCPGPYGDTIYTLEMTRKTYAQMLDWGLQLAQEGWRVILDATYDHRAERALAIANAQALNIPLRILYCTAPLEVLQQRICDRTDISDATLAVLAQQHQRAEPFTELERPYVTKIHTDRPLAPQLQQLDLS